VTNFKPGERVYTSATVTGAYAEYALCSAKTVYPLPENVSFEQGAALGVPYATAYRALFHRAKAIAGESVLVHGASGGVGTAAVQFARAAGLTVFGTSSSSEGKDLVKQQGAHHALDHKKPDYLEELMRLTGGKGVDIILEMLSNVNLGKDLPVLAKFGRVVVIGSRGNVEINPRDAMSRDASILGMTLFNASDSEAQSIHRAIYAGLENGTLRPIVGKEFPLEQAAAAHVAVMESGAYGKILLNP
jgi:NADPH2:quinone reductase